MTYETGSTILASDLNDFLTSAKTIYGVGTGDRGYGQTAITQAAVHISDVILSTHWTNLRNIIVTCANQQATGLTVLPPASVFAPEQIVIAYSGTSYEFKADLNTADQATGGFTSPDAFSTISLPIYLTAIDANRLNVAPTALSVASSVWSITRSAQWISFIDAEVSAVWPSEDAARAYFNTGGEIRLRGSQDSGQWSDILLNIVGTVKFAVHGTTNTGTLSSISVIGYYELTDTYQAVFTGSSVTIAAKRLNYGGVRGGNGTGVQFHITLNDTGVYYSVGNPIGTTFTFDNAKATTFLTGIISPTYTTIDPF
jgi:hypothetical protein